MIYIIYFSIKQELIVKKLMMEMRAKNDKTFFIESLILIELSNSDFKELVQSLYHFFKEHKLDSEDFVYIFNFSGIYENNWFCQILKGKGLKRVSSNFK
ncbi:hypothetical protein [Flavobacterium piscis]|uniref:Uncharacterized protein n=1 Tax=Flavobacterium piscis TaxID=1114874 RepID=A0ABU1Y6I2_9FLAO|nr:hypothetical protein [Flavobacterium piscis]MDR7209131.1 hypothetical protein [Flavobacterium piscis]